MFKLYVVISSKSAMPSTVVLYANQEARTSAAGICSQSVRSTRKLLISASRTRECENTPGPVHLVAGVWRFCRGQMSVDNCHLPLIITTSVTSRKLVPDVAGVWCFRRRQVCIDNRHLALIIRTSATSFLQTEAGFWPGQISTKTLQNTSLFITI